MTQTMQTPLGAAYRFHRQAGKLAAVALAKAREDSAAGKARYPASGPARPCYQPRESRSRDVLAYFDKPESFGFRHIGDVNPESGRYGDCWNTRGGASGYYTDPYGHSHKSGEGLCWGVVYQLPARGRRARFVAGYVFGGYDAGPFLDLATIYESPPGDNCRYSGATGNFAAIDAARAADSMAAREAEREREYQTAWQLGARYAEAAQEVQEARKTALALLRERREVKASAAERPAICAAIRSQVSALVADIREARDTMRKAIDGDGGNYLSVYMGERERAAFCEAAGLQTFPA